jgi:hypothetical protein
MLVMPVLRRRDHATRSANVNIVVERARATGAGAECDEGRAGLHTLMSTAERGAGEDALTANGTHHNLTHMSP